MSALRVAHVVPCYPPAVRAGGPPLAVKALCEALRDRGVHPEVFTTEDALDPGVSEPCDGVRREVEGVPVRRFAFSVRALRYSGALADALRREAGRFDLVHVHTLWNATSAIGCGAAQRAGVPYVVTPRGMLDPVIVSRRPWLRALYVRALARSQLTRAAGLHFTAEDERTRAVRYGSAAPAWVIPNAVPAVEPEPDLGRRFRDRFPELHGRRLVLFLGRLCRKKNLDVLARAFARVAAKRADAHLVLAGPDEDGTGGRAMAHLESAGLASRVTRTGPLDGADKRGAFEAADVFVLPSSQENFAMAVAEAMLARVPVVISRCVAIHDAVAEAGAGRVAEIDDGALAAAVSEILGDPERARRMGEAGRRLATARYGPEGVAARMVALYEDVVRGEKASPDRRS